MCVVTLNAGREFLKKETRWCVGCVSSHVGRCLDSLFVIARSLLVKNSCCCGCSSAGFVIFSIAFALLAALHRWRLPRPGDDRRREEERQGTTRAGDARGMTGGGGSVDSRWGTHIPPIQASCCPPAPRPASFPLVRRALPLPHGPRHHPPRPLAAAAACRVFTHIHTSPTPLIARGSSLSVSSRRRPPHFMPLGHPPLFSLVLVIHWFLTPCHKTQHTFLIGTARRAPPARRSALDSGYYGAAAWAAAGFLLPSNRPLPIPYCCRLRLAPPPLSPSIGSLKYKLLREGGLIQIRRFPASPLPPSPPSGQTAAHTCPPHRHSRG